MKHHHNGIFHVVLCLGICFGSISAQAGIIHVNNQEPGCVSEPGQPDPYVAVYCQIQDAVDDAQAEDILMIHAGTYSETLAISKPLLIQGDPTEDAPRIEIPEGDFDGVVISSDTVTLRKIHFYRDDITGWRAIVAIPKGGVWPDYTIEHEKHNYR